MTSTRATAFSIRRCIGERVVLRGLMAQQYAVGRRPRQLLPHFQRRFHCTRHRIPSQYAHPRHNIAGEPHRRSDDFFSGLFTIMAHIFDADGTRLTVDSGIVVNTIVHFHQASVTTL